MVSQEITLKDRLIAAQVVANMHGAPHWIQPTDIIATFHTDNNRARASTVSIRVDNGVLRVRAEFRTRRKKSQVWSCRFVSPKLHLDQECVFDKIVHVKHGQLVRYELHLSWSAE